MDGRSERRQELSAVADVHRHQVARAVLEAALDAIIVMDEAGVVIEWNPAAEELFGWDRDEAIGTELSDMIIPPELRESHRSGLAHFLATGEGPVLNTRVTLPAQHKDGSGFTVELAISPSETRGGYLFTGWLRDITELVEAREAVTRSEERLASLIANVSDIITVMAADGSWISSSGAGTRLLGYEIGFQPDGGIFSLVHPDDVGKAQAAFAEIVDGTRTSAEPVDLRVQGLDGSWHVLETVAENLIDDPAVESLVLTSRDVTEQRASAAELRQMSSQLAALVSSLGDGVLFVDSSGDIVYTNQAFCSTFGYEKAPAELVGGPSTQIRTQAVELVAEPEGFSTLIEQRLDQREPALGDEIALNDGRTLQRDYIPVDIADGESGHLWLYRDISARKTLEQTRERLLEIERGEREKAEDQARSLQEVADLKTELVAMVSHELRTPLTSIVSFADLLLADGDSLDAAEARDFVSVIDRNAKRLIRLVDDLLLLGQLESGVTSIEARECSATEIVRWAVESATNVAEEAAVRVTVTVDEGPPVYGDPGRLGQVLDNLLSNAIKFSAPEGRVEVTATQDAEAWTFAVTDNGVGIPDADQRRLFDSFFRATATARSTPGTGLGLAISKAIVELHGGTIGVSSIEGEGSRFEFTIPDTAEALS